MRTLRIFINSRDRLICLDGRTGEPVTSFGANGAISLVTDLKWKVDPKQFTSTSPPIVFRNLVIVGNGVADRHAVDGATGRELWKGALARRSSATPMTYRAKNGTQYVVIATGARTDAELVAFALRRGSGQAVK